LLDEETEKPQHTGTDLFTPTRRAEPPRGHSVHMFDNAGVGKVLLFRASIEASAGGDLLLPH
jgi:hypothetical protein